KLQL
ncbi:hypothetical protein ACTFIW_001039, partial [Dictyostelium discoideum]